MDIDKQLRDDEHSDEDYSFEDWKGMYCPYMYKCPFMYDIMPYKGKYRDEDEDEYVNEFDDEYDDVLEAIRPMHRPRCRWPYRPCWYGGRWHCCRRRRPRPRPRPYWMY